jgi:hypothetical protein
VVINERAGAVIGVLGTVVSCSAMMFSLFPALLGVVGASASSGTAMMGMGMTTSMPPTWVDFVAHYSALILAVSIGFMVWGIRRSSRAAKMVVALGIIVLIVNELSMTPYLFFPALGLIIGGNAMAWWTARGLKSFREQWSGLNSPQERH